MNPDVFFEYTYNFSYIPIYIYKHKKLCSKYCGSSSAEPPEMVISQIFAIQDSISVFETSIGSYYGRITVPSEDISVISGPVCPVKYSENSLLKFFYSYNVPSSKHDEYQDLLRTIPQYSLTSFLSLLHQMNCAFFDTETGKESVVPYHLREIPIEEEFTAQRSYKLESGYHNTLYDAHRLTGPLIRNGDIEGLIHYSKNAVPLHFGNYSLNPDKQQMVIFIVSLTYAMTAAIEGGLDQQTALSLFEMYVQKGLEMNSPADIESLSMQAAWDMAKRVKEQKDLLDNGIRPTIYDCIQYIREHIYTPITVSEVADYSGYNVDYFSRLFKKETGLNVRAFIMSCKLYESKKLLKFTNAAIGEISSQLHFANQSHFQREFKKKFQITPLQFRNSDNAI